LRSYDSFLELYIDSDKKGQLLRGEAELEFLERMYASHDAEREKECGVVAITFKPVHNH